MKESMTLKQRKRMEARMTNVFKEYLKVLPTELQRILVDDLVTAFQNRMNVLIRAQNKRSYRHSLFTKKT